MTIQKSNFTHKTESYIIYIFAVHYKDNVITHVKYFFKKDDGSVGEYTNTVEKIAKHVYLNQWQAWAGKYDENEQTISNAAKVVPGIKDGNIYLTTITDDYKTNNLESLPRF